MEPINASTSITKKVIIIGAGFGGLSATKSLRHAPVEITLFDQNNYHLFQPLLYQVATANLSPADIATPIRNALSKQSNVTVLMEIVISIDKTRQIVTTNLGNHYTYDYLIIATGAQHSYFGHDEWAPFTSGLKSLKEALTIREKILLAFEEAETIADQEIRKAYLTFVIVGAGPTGVEMAGAVWELATHALAHEFKHINPAAAKIILIEAGPRILNAFPEKLAKKAEEKLRQMGIEVCTGEKVISIEENSVQLSSRNINAHTIIWAAGVKASAAATWLDVATDKGGRIIVNPDLSIPNLPNIFAVGDTSACFDSRLQAYLPGVAPVAKQQGEYVGRFITQKLKGKDINPFHYHNYGNLAAIGHKYAIADFDKLQMGGAFTYVLWWIVHIYFLIGFRNRFFVFLNWLWSYFTFQRGARLILEEPYETKKKLP